MSNIIKWSPFFEGFDDADKMFSEFVPMIRRDGSAGFVPAVDVYEDKGNLIVETQLAGIDSEKVSIAIENDVLTIKGESEKKSEVEDKDYYRKEIRRGSFFRTIQLPAHVDGDKASAISESGILKISIPKREESQPKTIKIEKK
ncbi:MAG: Hsp20/alpha crystallin family protein [Patescibacteria group bacterium]|jgi:HSP20 family protein